MSSKVSCQTRTRHPDAGDLNLYIFCRWNQIFSPQAVFKHDNIVAQVINTHVTIIKKIVELNPDEDGSRDRGVRGESVINGHVEQPSGTGVDREMRELQEAIRLIRSNVHQPLRVYTVNNANER